MAERKYTQSMSHPGKYNIYIGGKIMATSSIFNTVTITDPKDIERFIKILEESEKTPSQKVNTNCQVLHNPEEIRKFLKLDDK